MTDLPALRRAYAHEMLRRGGVVSPALEEAYAAIPREHYLGAPPWKILRLTGYAETAGPDPAPLYDDVLVALVPERRINNGQPSAHAHWIAAADPRPGDHVVHIGAGTGYYTAILAHLVGPTGRVTAIELDTDLAARARANLAHLSNVTAFQGDGASLPFDPADVIYVNAGATRPADAWLDGLKEGGRLVMPLTAPGVFQMGGMFRFERRGEDYLARLVSDAAFIPCAGMRDSEAGEALAKAIAKGGAAKVTRLVRHDGVPEEQAWLRTPTWSLLY